MKTDYNVVQLRTAFAFFVRRHAPLFGRREIHEISVGRAIAALEKLQVEEGDEVAAILFTFASYPRCFTHLTRAMTVFITRDAAQGRGQFVRATSAELGRLVMDVVHDAVSYGDVCAWFAERLEPIEP